MMLRWNSVVPRSGDDGFFGRSAGCSAMGSTLAASGLFVSNDFRKFV